MGAACWEQTPAHQSAGIPASQQLPKHVVVRDLARKDICPFLHRVWETLCHLLSVNGKPCGSCFVMLPAADRPRGPRVLPCGVPEPRRHFWRDAAVAGSLSIAAHRVGVSCSGTPRGKPQIPAGQEGAQGLGR